MGRDGGDMNMSTITEQARLEVEAVRMCKEGKTMNAICTTLHLGDTKVRRWLTEAGLHPPTTKERRAMKLERFAKAAAFMVGGMGQNQAAAECHVDSQELRAYVRAGRVMKCWPAHCPLCGIGVIKEGTCADCKVEGRASEQLVARPHIEARFVSDEAAMATLGVQHVRDLMDDCPALSMRDDMMRGSENTRGRVYA